MAMIGKLVLGLMLATVGICAAAAEQQGQAGSEPPAQALEWIRVSDDGTHFVGAATGRRIVMWGVNYDHDEPGRLIEDYWHSEWDKVAEDFAEIKALGSNVVRVHLQLAKFMDTADNMIRLLVKTRGKADNPRAVCLSRRRCTPGGRIARWRRTANGEW